MLQNIHLTTKVFGSLLVAILGMLIIAISSYISFNKIGLEIVAIAEYQVPINKHITELEANILKEEALTYELLLESKDINSQSFIAVKEKLTALERKTDAIILKAEELVSQAIAHNKKEQAKQTYTLFLKELKVLEKEQKLFKQHLLTLLQKLQNNEIDSIDTYKESLHQDLSEMDTNIVQLMHQMEELLAHSTHQAEKDEQQALFIIEVISAIVIIISLLLSYLLLHYIKQKFKNFQNSFVAFFDFLNRKSSDVILADDKHSDEFGLMSKVLNENIEKAKASIEEDRKVIEETIHVLSEFEQGDLCQRVSIESNNPSLLKLTQLLNQMGSNLEMNIDDILSVLEEYTNNNYLNRVKVEGLKEHLLRLSTGINTLGDAITESLQTRKRNALTLKSSANTLKQNVESLSTSSNEAATSLEETAAALEEITSTSVRNTDNITSMANYATQVTQSSNQGEKLANETMSAMDEINDEVNSINEAITVIDQIAFQTNILSLNAAVEAATAGEAGKGFAVVAQEVRNLASRSAEAAKEIKELVETATVKANSGKQIAQNMLNGYESLNSDIEKTLQLINSVDDASQEQKSGIEQINDAVTQLDQQTQKNSAAAMETNDIAITTEKLSETMLNSINTNEFEGKESVVDRRSQCRDLNYQGQERRRAEQTIKQTRTVNNSTPSHNDKEWESF